MKKILIIFSFLFLWFPGVSHAALTTNIVSYYKLDESSGNAADSVGGVTLTNNGSATYSAGKINNGVSLSGSASQYLSASDNATTDTPTTAITVAGWYKATSSFVSQPIVSKNYSGSWTAPYASWLLRVDSSTVIGFGLNLGGTFTNYEATVPTMTAGTWYYIVGVYDGSHIYVYLNGVSQGTPPAASGTIGYSTGTLMLGRDGSAAEVVNGMIDEVGIWSRALTSTEVTQLYNSGAGLQYPFTTTPSIPWILSSWIHWIL